MNWEHGSSAILTISIVTSHILGLLVAALSVVLVFQKIIVGLWGRYKGRQEGQLKALVEVYLEHESTQAKLRLERLGWGERILLRAILLDKAEGAAGIRQRRLETLYEVSGATAEDIRTLARSWFWWHRAAAAHRLGQMKAKRAKGHLIYALKDKNTEVRLEATWGLGHMGFVDTLPLIVESMAHYFKIAALRMDDFIFEMGSHAFPLLLDLCKHPEPEVQILAIHLLGEFKEPSSVKTLLNLLDIPHLEIRLAACKALGTIGDPGGLSALVSCLEDAAWQMRSQAAKQIGKNRATSAIPPLIKCLEDQNWWVRFNAGEALAQMGGTGKRALQTARHSPDRFARDMAAQWIDEMEAAAS